MSLVVGTDKILVPYATSNLLTSLKRSMPFGDEISKVKRCVLFNTNSAMNFSNGVVTYTLLAKSCNINAAKLINNEDYTRNSLFILKIGIRNTRINNS